MGENTITISLQSNLLSNNIIKWLATATPKQTAVALSAGIKAFNVFAAFANDANANDANDDVDAANDANADADTTAVAEAATITPVPTYNWEIVEKSVERGKLAEEYIVGMLTDKFGADRVHNTAKTSKSGDIEVNVGNALILVEIKNYTSTIAKAEVEKFRRDLVVRKPHAGIFVSLNTNIVGIETEFEIRYERIESNIIPCVYMVGRLSSTIYHAVLLLHQIVASKQHLLNDIYAGEIVRVKVDRIAEATSSLTRYRSDMSENISAIQRMLCKNWQDFTSAEIAIKDSVDIIVDQFNESSEVIGGDESILDKFTPRNIAEVREAFRYISHLNGADSVWKITNKKIQHTHSGIEILFSRIMAEIAIPVSHVDEASLVKLIALFGAHFKIASNMIVLPLAQPTLSTALGIL